MDTKNIPLEVLRVREPCSADWDSMQGAGAVRFCGHCQKNVYNLSAMPREEAERIVCEKAGNLCARFATDAAGAVITLDYQAAKRRRRGWPFWSVLGVFSVMASVTVQAFFRQVSSGTAPTMGMVCPVTRPVTPATNATQPTVGEETDSPQAG
jgi:hypothetical protein